MATVDELIPAMLRAAQVTNKDRVIDLGSGDGKIPIVAAKRVLLAVTRPDGIRRFVGSRL